MHATTPPALCPSRNTGSPGSRAFTIVMNVARSPM